MPSRFYPSFITFKGFRDFHLFTVEAITPAPAPLHAKNVNLSVPTYPKTLKCMKLGLYTCKVIRLYDTLAVTI